MERADVGATHYSKAEAKRLTKRGAMAVAAYHVWQQLKVWEEAERAKREAEAEGSEDEEEAGAVVEEWQQRAKKPIPVPTPKAEGQPKAAAEPKAEGEVQAESEAQARLEPKTEVEPQGKRAEEQKEKIEDKEEHAVDTGSQARSDQSSTPTPARNIDHDDEGNDNRVRPMGPHEPSSPTMTIAGVDMSTEVRGTDEGSDEL